MAHRLESSPVFLIADEDREAADRMTGQLSPEYFYIHVRTGAEVLRYVRGFSLAGILLSDSIPFESGGVDLILDRLVQDGARVVVLSEITQPSSVARWKELGAFDCISHPTKTLSRLVALRAVIENLTALYVKPAKTAPGEVK